MRALDRVRSIGFEKYLYCGLLFVIFNWIDWIDLGDPFRQGKFRYIFLALVPLIFFFFKKHLHWVFGYFASLYFFYWVMGNYSVYATLPMICIMAVSCLSIYLVNKPIDKFADILVLSGVFQSIVAAFQSDGVHFLFQPTDGWGVFAATGTYGHPTILGPFLVCALAPALWRKQYPFAFIIFVGIILCKSSMTLGALASVLLIFLWHKKGFKFAALIASSLIASGIFLFTAYPGLTLFSTTGRWAIWEKFPEAFNEAPLFGSGVGMWIGKFAPRWYEHFLGKFQVHIPFELHNDVMEFLVQFGIVPFIPIFFALCGFFRRLKPTWPHAVCVALLLNAQGNFPLQIATIAMVFCVSFVWAERFSNRGAYEVDREELEAL